MSRRKTINAIIFSIVMVLSMVAIATAGAGAAVADDPQSEDGAQLADESAEISPQLQRSDELEEVYIMLESPEIPDHATDRESIASFLKDYTSTSQEPVLSQLDDLEVDVLNTYWIDNIVRAEIDAGSSDLDRVASMDAVEQVIPVPEYTFDDAGSAPLTADDTGMSYDQQENGTWAWDQINVSDAWDQGLQGEGINLTVIDSGIDAGHEDIDLFTEDSDDPTYPGGYARVDENGDIHYEEPVDQLGHGTSTSGLAGAQPPADDAAVGGIYGVAPGANLKHLALDTQPPGFIIGDSLAGFQYAINPNGTLQADITSMSFGASPSVYEDAWIGPIQNARSMGIPAITSSGNDGEGQGLVGSPANIYDSISIGATTQGLEICGAPQNAGCSPPNNWGSSGWQEDASNWANPPSEWPDTWIEPSTAAPGESVPTSADGGGYSESSGTSFSAPATAGAYALLKQHAPDASVDEMEEAFEETAWKPGFWDPDDAAFSDGDADSRYGHGILHVGDAVDYLGPDVSELPLGDVDESGNVTIDDAVLIQEYLAEIIDPNATFNEDLGDVDRDGEVTIDDAVKVQEYLAELITQGEIEVSDLDAPDAVDAGEPIELTANLTNVAEMGAIETIEAHLADDFADPISSDEMAVDMAVEGVEDPVDLPSEAEVSFTIETDDVAAGNYSVGVFSEDDEQTTDVEVEATETFFEVDNVIGPEEVYHGDEITTAASVENTGDIPDEQEITYELGASGGAGDQIAVVGPQEAQSEGTGDRLTETVDLLEDELDTSVYDIEIVHAADVLGVMDDYDVFVMYRYGADDADADGNQLASDFLDELGSGQAVVQMGTRAGGTDSNYPGGVKRMNEVRDNPQTYEESNGGTVGAGIEITTDHPIWTGIGSQGDVADMVQPVGFGEDYHLMFEDYSGTTLGESTEYNAPTVAIDDDPDAGLTEILVGNTGPNYFVDTSDLTDEGRMLLGNSVEYAAAGAVADGAAVPNEAIVEQSQTVQLDPGEFTVVEFDYTVTASDGVGSFAHTIASEDDDATKNVEIYAPEQIDITGMDAPEEALQGESIEINVSLEHVGLEPTTQDVEYLFDGSVELSESVTMDPGDQQTVTFNFTVPEDIDPGNFTHGAQTDFTETDSSIEVLESDPANFEVTSFDAPGQAGQGDTISINATITNSGQLTDTQEVSYVFGEDGGGGGDDGGEPGSVAVVTPDGTSRDHGDRFLNFLQPQFADLDDDWEISHVPPVDLLDEMGDYDTFVINRFAHADEGVDGDQLATDFHDQLGDDQDVVYLDSYTGASEATYGDGVERLNNVFDDPATYDSHSSGDSDNAIDITEDHPIFTDVGESGDTVPIFGGSLGYVAWFDDYSGTTLADISSEGMPTIGISEDDSQILWASGAETFFTWASDSDPLDDRTEEGGQLLVNMIEYAQTGEVTGSVDAAANETTAYAEEGLDVESLDYADLEIKSPAIQDDTDEELTLGPGESADVSFTYTIGENAPVGFNDHGVTTADTDHFEEIYVDEQSADIGVTGWFPDPDPAEGPIFVGDTMTASVVVVNQGDLTGERDIRLFQGGEIVDNQTVELDPGEGTVVELEHTFTESGTTQLSANGVDPIQFDVQDPDPADFQVTIDDYDDPVMHGEEIDVNATVHNAGEEPVEQTIEFLVNDSVVDSQAVDLRYDESTQLSFTLETDEDDVPAVALEVASEDDAADVNATVDAPAEFEMTVDDIQEEVVAGEEIVADVQVENVGTLPDEQNLGAYVDGTFISNNTVQLDGGESSIETFTWSTDRDDIGTLDFEFTSANDSAAATVDVLDVPADLEIEITDIDPASPEPGESFTVDANVTNDGTVAGNDTVEFSVDGALVLSETVNVSGEGTTGVTFSYETDSDDGGEELDVEVALVDYEHSDDAVVPVGQAPASAQTVQSGLLA